MSASGNGGNLVTPRIWPLTGALLTACFLTGCSDPTAKLLGKWQNRVKGLDPVTTIFTWEIKGETEFKKDGGFSIKLESPYGGADAAGKWRFVKVDGKALIVAIKADGAPERETRLEFTDDDHFTTERLVSIEGLNRGVIHKLTRCPPPAATKEEPVEEVTELVDPFAVDDARKAP